MTGAGRCGEVLASVVRCWEVRRGDGRYGEVWGGDGRCGEVIPGAMRCWEVR